MRIPSYRKHSSGQARVTIRGRDYLLGEFGSKASRQLYNRLISEYVSADCSPAFGVKPSELTIIELGSAYKEHCLKYYGNGPSSEWHRIRIGLRALNGLYADLAAVSFGPLEYKAVRQFIQDGKNTKPRVKGKLTKAGLPAKPHPQPSRQYINSLMKKLRRMFAWAAGEGMLPAAIADSLGKVDPLKMGRCSASERARVKPVDEKIVMATLPSLPPVF